MAAVDNVTHLTSQSNIRSVSNKFEDVELFSGMLALDRGNIGQYDFMVTGYAQFYWVNMPTFMEIANPNLCKRFKNLTEKSFTSFDGINDMAVSTEDMTGGIAGNSFKVLTNIKKDFDTFTIKVPEIQGSALREALTYWAYGIRDPEYGFANYHGLVDTIDGGYCAKNHTAELIYIVTDPSGGGKGVEYACLITNIMPTKIPMGHLNFNTGEHSLAQLDLEFTGTKYESAWINQQASIILKNKRTVRSYMNYVPKLEGSSKTLL